MSTEQLLRTINHIYEASYTNDKWPQVLQGIVRLIKVDSGAMFYYDHEVSEASGSYAYNVPEKLFQLYNSRSHAGRAKLGY